MAQTAANLIDHVLPRVPLRQFVLTLPFELRPRLAYDGKLLGAVGRIFADSVLGFYRHKLRAELGVVGQSGAVTVVQRTSADLRLNPHFHAIESRQERVVLDDGFAEREPALAQLAAAAVSGLAPAGPVERHRPAIPVRGEPGVEITAPLSVAELGFSLHARTTAAADDVRGREALVKTEWLDQPTCRNADYAGSKARRRRAACGRLVQCRRYDS